MTNLDEKPGMNLTRGQLLDLMLDVEDRLRELIRAVFAGHFGGGWEGLIPKSVRQQLRDAQTTEAGDPWATSWKQDLLDYASLAQLIDLIKRQWALFQPILADKLYVSSRLEEFRHRRNDLAHGAHPGLEERAQIAFLVDEIATKLLAGVRPGFASTSSASPSGYALNGARILWVDDHPENNRLERRLLEDLGAEVVPVLSNEEALDEAMAGPFQLAISDIARDEGEPGSEIGIRFAAAGIKVPVVFYVGRVEGGLDPPVMGVAVTNDRALLLKYALEQLT